METIKVSSRLTTEERETVLNYDGVDKVWTMYSTIPKHFRKAVKQGWTPVRTYMYEDGTVCAMALVGSERSVTIRNTAKKQMSDKQMCNLISDDDDEDDDCE